jgi:hypothetical protein
MKKVFGDNTGIDKTIIKDCPPRCKNEKLSEAIVMFNWGERKRL